MHMNTLEAPPIQARSNYRTDSLEVRHERWAHCHVNWTAVVVGALAAFAMVLLFGLVAIALPHVFGPDDRMKLGTGALIFSVCAAFFSFVVGGWVTAKIAGILHSEPAMLHGAIACLATIPLLVLVAGLGAASVLGGWYTGLAGNSHGSSTSNAPFIAPDVPVSGASADEIAVYRGQRTDYDRKVQTWVAETPRVTRNAAVGTITALLLGLIGSVIGGWMASGEPMNFTHHLTRKPLYHSPVA
jgi:hypothetical protein